MRSCRCVHWWVMCVSLVLSGCVAVSNGDLPDQDDAVRDDDASVPVGDDDTTASGDDDASAPGDDDTSDLPGDDDDTSSPTPAGDDDTSSPTGDDDTSSPTPAGDDDTSSPTGDDDTSGLPGDDDDASSPTPAGDDDTSSPTPTGDDDSPGSSPSPTPSPTAPPSPDDDLDGFSLEDGDCDDQNPGVYPGASETCNGMDDDCDTQIDDGLMSLYFVDVDDDGFGDAGQTTQACTQPDGYVDDDTDCDDLDPNTYPGAPELCDGVDNDCDEEIDEGGQTPWYEDADGDDYGNASISLHSCEKPEGYVADNTDCDDADATRNPAATEQCDGVDHDCDGAVGSEQEYYLDFDGDEFGDPELAALACDLPVGYAENPEDCDDLDPDVYPGAYDLFADEKDSNCNDLQDWIALAAGNGNAASSGDGGLATSAAIWLPRGTTVDGQGNLYIADSGHRIRKVTPSGYIYTVAGTGTAGFSGDGGQATLAQLNGPSDVALDADGNLYIADAVNNRIRRVAPTGEISTFAGSDKTKGNNGDGGPATGARMTAPYGVAVDAARSVYIAESGSHVIRKVSTSGLISTFAGTGVAGFSGDGGAPTSAQLYQPTDVMAADDGAIYIADTYNHRVRRISGGVIATIAGGGTSSTDVGDGGPASLAVLQLPSGVALDEQGALFVADYGHHRIRMVGADGTIDTVAGTGTASYTGDGGPSTAATLNLPWSVAFDADGSMFISDGANNRVRSLSW